MTEIDGFNDLNSQVDALEASLGQATNMATVFQSELDRMRSALGATGQDLRTLERGLSSGLSRAFNGLVFDGLSLSSALEQVAQSMIRATYNAALKPVTDHFGGLIAQGIGGVVQNILPFENGGSFTQGRVMPFASGGIVGGPTMFPMRGGMGLMGEAGPEAIMPLARGPDGKLGVRGGGGAPVNIVMNISTPDVSGFQRSQSQIAAQMSRAIGRGQRNR